MLTLHQAGLETIPAIHPMDGTVKPGQLLAIVGPNGAGKSTLLSLLSGFRPCELGHISLDEKPLSQWKIDTLASRRALVAQQEIPGFAWQVEELVSLGSSPGAALLAEVLDDLDLIHLARRSVLSLSGGERQRVMIARGACQLLSRRTEAATDGGLLLLDEPTSALDIGQQQRLMRQLRRWAIHHHMAIVCVLHDLNLASLFADRVWLLHQGKRIAQGTPSQVLTSDVIASTYAAQLQTVTAGQTQLLALRP
ncbi:ATP-binding cassette domain-containing protein [Vreelandella aquamarina]